MKQLKYGTSPSRKRFKGDYHQPEETEQYSNRCRSKQHPLQLATATLFVLIILVGSNQTSANLCTLCQSLRDRLPKEFHSCVLRNYEIKHCEEGVDTHLSSLKIVGVKRLVKVNYDQGDGVVWWEVGVSVVQDGGVGGGESHHHTQNTSLHHNSQQSPSSNGHYPSSSTQQAIIRFNRYPASILLQNPCSHVLGTINYNNLQQAMQAKKNNILQHHVPTQQQRIGSVGAASIGLLSTYFVIDDKMCRDGGGHRGMMIRKRKCVPTPSNSTHPYNCCVIQKSSTECPVNSPPPQHHQGNTEDQDYLRPLTLSIQCICICFTLILSCIVFWIRKSKVIQVSVWPLTESIIFGSTLLYAAVALRASYKFDIVEDAHHQLSDWFGEGEEAVDQSKYWACIAEPWAREMGFTLIYGGVVLKIYRNLVEFKTRKAHRWVVREKDILRYLGTTLSVTFFYLVAWSCTVGDFRGVSASGNGGIVCPAITNWHRVTEIGELMYIAVGLNMAWHLRTSPVSPFLERQMYTAALVLEATASVLLILVRECKLMFFSEEENGSQNGEWENGEAAVEVERDDGAFLLMLYFVRCHITTTVILGLVLGPKLYYVYVDASSRKRAGQIRRGETLTTTGGAGGTGAATDAQRSASLSNLTTLKIPPHGTGGIDQATLIDLDFAEVSLAEMDPQDIKMELKRVYTQLELLRNKTMRKDNPHISKRRGGRKPTHRRFSLQKKGSRDKTAAAAAAMRSRLQAQQQMQEEGRGGYGNNRFGGRYNDDIEDSVCSIEGPSTYSEVGGGYR